MINTVDENVTPGISVQAPAPAVSSVKVVAAQIKSDGYVYVTVQVAGYGKNIYAISVIYDSNNLSGYLSYKELYDYINDRTER